VAARPARFQSPAGRLQAGLALNLPARESVPRPS
jgi:hypothetical protein